MTNELRQRAARANKDSKKRNLKANPLPRTSSAGAQENPDPHKSVPARVEFISDDETDESEDENE